MKSRRYATVAENTSEAQFLLSNSSSKIMKALAKKSECDYITLSRLSKVPIASLYVFVKRLEAAKLVKRKKGIVHGYPRTKILLNNGVTMSELNIIG